MKETSVFNIASFVCCAVTWFCLFVWMTEPPEPKIIKLQNWVVENGVYKIVSENSYLTKDLQKEICNLSQNN